MGVMSRDDNKGRKERNLIKKSSKKMFEGKIKMGKKEEGKRKIWKEGKKERMW